MPFDALAFFSALNATSPSRLFFSFAEEEFFSPPDPSLPAIATSHIAGYDSSNRNPSFPSEEVYGVGALM